ncbi:MAG: four helix bundle protein [Candidatus Paceibacterota bacterium]|jgi:four helix bundle protein
MEHENKKNDFHDKLKDKIDKYIHSVYKLTKGFPREEMYGSVSQLRRSAMSVMLNYIEGYARIRDKVHKNFIEISYGSLQESKYLLDFSFEEEYLLKDEYDKVMKLAEEIGAMLWGILRKI